MLSLCDIFESCLFEHRYYSRDDCALVIITPVIVPFLFFINLPLFLQWIPCFQEFWNRTTWPLNSPFSF